VNELTSQLTQQTEYSASMGAACATLLWRVSRRDDAVETLLTGVSVVKVWPAIYSRTAVNAPVCRIRQWMKTE